jgi:hypothetical protein
MEFVGKLLKCDSPTPHTGRIYPREVVEKAIEEYMAREPRLGETDPEHARVHASLEASLTTYLENVSHEVVDTFVDDSGNWIARIRILDKLDCGFFLQQAITMGVIPRLGHRGSGTVDKDFKVSNLSIAAIDALEVYPLVEIKEKQKTGDAACSLIQELPSKKDGSQALPTKKHKSSLMQSILHWIKSL